MPIHEHRTLEEESEDLRDYARLKAEEVRRNLTQLFEQVRQLRHSETYDRNKTFVGELCSHRCGAMREAATREQWPNLFGRG